MLEPSGEATTPESSGIFHFLPRQWAALAGGAAVLMYEMKYGGDSQLGRAIGTVASLTASSPFVEKLIQLDRQDTDAT
jgi:hypothetical protein